MWTLRVRYYSIAKRYPKWSDSVFYCSMKSPLFSYSSRFFFFLCLRRLRVFRCLLAANDVSCCHDDTAVLTTTTTTDTHTICICVHIYGRECMFTLIERVGGLTIGRRVAIWIRRKSPCFLIHVRLLLQWKLSNTTLVSILLSNPATSVGDEGTFRRHTIYVLMFGHKTGIKSHRTQKFCTFS